MGPHRHRTADPIFVLKQHGHCSIGFEKHVIVQKQIDYKRQRISGREGLSTAQVETFLRMRVLTEILTIVPYRPCRRQWIVVVKRPTIVPHTPRAGQWKVAIEIQVLINERVKKR